MPINLTDPNIYNNDENRPTDGVKLRTDLNTIITQVNTNESSLTTILTGNPTFTGNPAYSGNPTFTGNPAYSGNPTFTGNPTLSSSTAITATSLSNRAFALGDSIRGSAPTWASNTTINMPALRCLDSTRAVEIATNSATLNFATVGLNGLDTGSLASNTWYYTWSILNPTTGATGYLASTSATSPTMPSGFTVRRLLPLALKSRPTEAALMRFIVFHWGNFPRVEWTNTWDFNTTMPAVNNTTEDTTEVANYSSTSYISVSLASFVPFFSRLALVSTTNSSAGTGAVMQLFRLDGTTTDSHKRLYHDRGTNFHRYEFLLHLNANQTINTRVTNGSCQLSVSGYQVTEIVG